MITRYISAFIVLVGCLIAAPANTQTLTQAQIAPLVNAALKTGAGNPDKTRDALDKALKASIGDFEKNPIDLSFARTAFVARLFSPYHTFRSELGERLRKFESLDGLELVENEVTVWIIPRTTDSLDFRNVVVQRDGVTIEPLRNNLAPEAFQNGLGHTVMVRTGTVVFPIAAFAPGAAVSVILIPSSGANVVTKLDPKQLAKFR